ncbi:MAG: DNA repair protein RadC [Methanoregula sp.]|nr:DNA repair protein RadC [Methanoregula sp.]
MKMMKDVPVRDRPREKIVRKGVTSLSDQELIESILGRGTKGNDVRVIARELSGLIKDSQATVRYDDLISIKGIGPSKAAQILACIEMGRRYCAPTDGRIRVTKPQDILPITTIVEMRDKRQEHFICITLTGAGEVLNSRIITVGLLNHSLVHPREVFADAITDRAASVICVHNHPSGSLEPSPQDISITNQLRDAGLLLGIQLIDHIIVTKSGYLSMKERGLL